MKFPYRSLLFLLPLLLTASTSAQTIISLTPEKDNTLFEAADGSLSNGAGPSLFSGVTSSGNIRRALLKFDLSGMVPPGATITGASLTLNMSKTTAGAETLTLHRVLTDWGEGASVSSGGGGAGAPAQTGDATWLHTFFDTDMWSTPGGDFDATSSAGTSVDGIGFYVWTSSTMVSDLQNWLDQPGENFGWILIGNETTSTTSKRFESREAAFEGDWPMLAVSFTTATATEDEAGPGSFGLSQNFPNPFSSRTSIAFTLSTPGHVRLGVFDLLGREVASLYDAVAPVGPQEVEFDGTGLAPGIYLYHFTAQGSTQTRTMVLFPGN